MASTCDKFIFFARAILTALGMTFSGLYVDTSYRETTYYYGGNTETHEGDSFILFTIFMFILGVMVFPVIPCLIATIKVIFHKIVD